MYPGYHITMIYTDGTFNSYEVVTYQLKDCQEEQENRHQRILLLSFDQFDLFECMKDQKY